jgi:hypothetical protein
MRCASTSPFTAAPVTAGLGGQRLGHHRNGVTLPAAYRRRRGAAVDIEQFMRGYQAAWEQRDEAMFCRLFASDGEYWNTPFAVQRGHAALAEYWRRVKLQQDVHLSYEVLARTPAGGIAHWHVTYQVASEELFRIWAQSTGTNLVARHPGDPLPRMVLDGVLQAAFEGDACRQCRIWWHSLPQPA